MIRDELKKNFKKKNIFFEEILSFDKGVWRGDKKVIRNIFQFVFIFALIFSPLSAAHQSAPPTSPASPLESDRPFWRQQRRQGDRRIGSVIKIRCYQLIRQNPSLFPAWPECCPCRIQCLSRRNRRRSTAADSRLWRFLGNATTWNCARTASFFWKKNDDGWELTEENSKNRRIREKRRGKIRVLNKRIENFSKSKRRNKAKQWAQKLKILKNSEKKL